MDDLGPPREDLFAGQLGVSADEVTCQQFVELVTDYLEGALPTPTLSHVEEHLVMCDWCVAYVQQMQSTVASLHELREPSFSQPADAVLDALRARKEARR